MKKLMIALAAVSMAVSVQASSCIWSAGIAAYNGVEGDMPIEAGTFWLVALNGGSASDISVGEGGVLKIGTGMTSSAATMVEDPFGIAGEIPELTSSANGKMYAIVIWDNDMSYGIGTGAIANIADDPPADGDMFLMNGTSSTFGDAPVVYLDKTVEPIPEPTSGLLLLLGVAGLALRRRRA